MTTIRSRGNAIPAPLAIIALVVLVGVGTYLTLTLKNADQELANTEIPTATKPTLLTDKNLTDNKDSSDQEEEKDITPGKDVGEDINTKTIDFEVIKTDIGLDQKLNQVIDNDSVWQDLWQKGKITQFDEPGIRPSPPKIDFNKYAVIAVFAGAKTTGGHEIKVTSIEEQIDKIVVNITETTPGKGCLTTQSITYPSQLVKVPKITKEVAFNLTSNTQDCGNNQQPL